MTVRVQGLAVIAAGLSLAGCATTNEDVLADMFAPVTPEKVAAVEKAAVGYPLGSKENPVRAAGPSGQRDYIARLRCSDGNPPTIAGRGSVGDGPYGKIMDQYEIRCSGGQPATASLFMDMYHASHVEDRPVPGFAITPK